MTNEYRLIETTPQIYFDIYRRHKEQLKLFGTCTMLHEGVIDTEWGFKDADYPLMKCSERWDADSDTGPRTYKYWLVCPKAGG